jgi:hypothetical protein
MRHLTALADQLEANKLTPATRDLVRISSLKVISWADQHPGIDVSDHPARKLWAVEKSCA